MRVGEGGGGEHSFTYIPLICQTTSDQVNALKQKHTNRKGGGTKGGNQKDEQN